MIKRIAEAFLALIGLILLFPLFCVVSILIACDSFGPVFFKQERVGKEFRPFLIYKFRTMMENAPNTGTSITFGDDLRITRVGRILRKTKIDELPQLINVFKGEMSFVGPRPEVREYVKLFQEDYQEILSVRPGITDLASIKYRHEATVLGRSKNPQEEYVKRILPEKISLAKEYLQQASFFFDLVIIFRTLFKVYT